MTTKETKEDEISVHDFEKKMFKWMWTSSAIKFPSK